jgi:hypothetical protein
LTWAVKLGTGGTTQDQEGFRWRNDDGSETTATWRQSQDADTGAPLAANVRLRALVDTTGPASTPAPTLYYKKSTDGAYLPVNVGSTIAQTAPVVETTAETAVSTAGTSHAITLPAGIVSTDLVLITMDIGSTSATLNSLTDWGEILDESAANGLKILWYTGSGVPSNPTFTSSASTRSASIAWRISNADKTVTPQIGTTATGTSTTPDPPSVTPSAGSKPHLFIAFFGSAGEEADDDTWVNSPPTNYLPNPPLQKACGTVGTNLGGLIGAASRQLTTGSAENPGTFSIDVSAAWRAQTIIVHPATPPTPPIYIATSANVTAGGEATTAQLTAPSGKTTSDFDAGRMWDNENGTDTVSISDDDYTEVEWSLQAQSPAADGDIYQFRVYNGATPLDTYTVTPQWTVGGFESASPTDAVGITDTAAKAQVKSRTDTVGITDSIVKALIKSRVDAIGITEIVDVSEAGGADSVSPTDNVGITDSVAKNLVKSRADNVGITDATTRAETDAVSTTDNIGITDSLVKSSRKGPVDPVGITDTTDVLRDRVIEGDADQIGITDSAAVVKSKLVTRTENIGITDTAVRSRTSARVDAVGITDMAARSLGKPRVDNIGITDSVAVVKSKLLTPVDNVGITDSTTSVEADAVSPVDNVGITDSITTSKTGAETVNTVNPVGITDSVAFVVVRTRGIVDVVGISDSISSARAIFRSVADAVGITDTVPTGGDVLDAIIICDVTGPATRMRASGPATDFIGATGPARDTHGVTGPDVQWDTDGPELVGVGVGTVDRTLHTPTGPAVDARTTTGPRTESKVVTGPSNRCA